MPALQAAVVKRPQRGASPRLHLREGHAVLGKNLGLVVQLDLTFHEGRVAELSDPSPATDSEPPAPDPIESDWAPIMEFTSADIFQHSPLGDILNTLRSLSLSGGSWPNYVRPDWDADDEEICRPPTTHLVAIVDDLTDMLDFDSEDINGMDDDEGDE